MSTTLGSILAAMAADEPALPGDAEGDPSPEDGVDGVVAPPPAGTVVGAVGSTGVTGAGGEVGVTGATEVAGVTAASVMVGLEPCRCHAMPRPMPANRQNTMTAARKARLGRAGLGGVAAGGAIAAGDAHGGSAAIHSGGGGGVGAERAGP